MIVSWSPTRNRPTSPCALSSLQPRCEAPSTTPTPTPFATRSHARAIPAPSACRGTRGRAPSAHGRCRCRRCGAPLGCGWPLCGYCAPRARGCLGRAHCGCCGCRPRCQAGSTRAGAAPGCRGGCGTALPSCPPVRPRAQRWAGRCPQAAQSHLRRPPLLVSFLLNSVTFQRHCGHSHRFSRPLFFFSLAGDPLPHPLPHLFWCVEALNFYQADTHRPLVSAVWRLLVPFNLLIPQPTPFPVPNAPPSKPEVSATPPPPSPHTHASYVRNKS